MAEYSLQGELSSNLSLAEVEETTDTEWYNKVYI